MPADVALTLPGWVSTDANNAPSGSTSVSSNLDDNLRTIQGVVVRGLSHKGADIASAATTDLGAVEGLQHNITGTTTITSFGTVRAGIWKMLTYTGALTLTHSASLILLGAENRTTAAGDTQLVSSEGSGIWRERAYFPATINPGKMVSTDEAQTLTNKTLTSPAVNGGTITSATLVTTNIGTPSTGNLANCVGLTEAGLNSGIVSQGKLKTTTASGSVAILNNTASSYTLTGGTYAWWTAGADNGTSNAAGILFGNGNVAAGVIGLLNIDNVATLNFYVDERYVQASPPYNLGNGDIPLFVMALVDSSGKIHGASVAPDPTWAYNGPTDITPQWFDNGKAYRRYTTLRGIPLAIALKDEATARAFLAGEIEAVHEDLEITRELKNRDMNLVPHAWVRNDLNGHKVVMLEPVGAVVDRLAMIHADQGAREVRNLLLNGYLTLDNTRLAVNAPAAVMPVRAAWRR